MTEPKEWPVVTVPIYWDHYRSGATPVVLGCRPTPPNTLKIEGERVGYVSGGVWPAGMSLSPPSFPDRDGCYVDIWVSLDPDELAKLPAVIAAVQSRIVETPLRRRSES